MQSCCGCTSSSLPVVTGCCSRLAAQMVICSLILHSVCSGAQGGGHLDQRTKCPGLETTYGCSEPGIVYTAGLQKFQLLIWCGVHTCASQGGRHITSWRAGERDCGSVPPPPGLDASDSVQLGKVSGNRLSQNLGCSWLLSTTVLFL